MAAAAALQPPEGGGSTAGSVRCGRQIEVAAGSASARVLARSLQALGVGSGEEQVSGRARPSRLLQVGADPL